MCSVNSILYQNLFKNKKKKKCSHFVMTTFCRNGRKKGFEYAVMEMGSLMPKCVKKMDGAGQRRKFERLKGKN